MVYRNFKALRIASKNKKTNKPSIHHSDRGLQYCSEIYQSELRQNNITPSITDGYDCYQNTLAERINGILKNEFLIYNKRPHLSLKNKSTNFAHEKTVRN